MLQSMATPRFAMGSRDQVKVWAFSYRKETVVSFLGREL